MKSANIDVIWALQEQFSQSLVEILYGENLDREIFHAMNAYLS